MGETDRPLFQEATLSKANISIIRFDWSGITLATGSYLRAAYSPLFQKRGPAVILSSDMATSVAEDFEIVLENQGLFALLAKPDPRRRHYEISVLGNLDPVYLETLAIIRDRPNVTAGELFSEDTTNIGKTAWMNRLSRLYEMGLLCKEKTGKEFRYSYPQTEALANG